MLKKIFFDNREFHFDKTYLPTLIHGEEGSGASLFTMALFVDLYLQKTKVIALTGFSMAREEFEKQTKTITGTAQFFTKEYADSFIDTIQNLSDVNEYVILIKNIELFNEEIFNAVKNFNNIIVSGDINQCSFKENLLQKTFITKICFSSLDEPLPQLEKYQGYLKSLNANGTVSLKANFSPSV